MQQNYTDKVFAIKEIEPISESSFVVRLEVLPKINEEATKKFYEEQRHLAKTTYRLAQENTQIPCQHHTQIIELYKQNNSDMIEIIKLLASRSINVEATAMSNSEKFINNLQGANINSFANQISDRACQNANQYNYNPETKSLASVAIEIQALLDRLSQIYPTDTMAAKVTLATEAIQYIDNNPSFAQRIIRALQSGSISALEQFLSHPAASFFISALEDWQKTREQ